MLFYSGAWIKVLFVRFWKGHVLLRAFKIYVQPILEFNTTVWSPVQKKKHWSHRESTASVYEETLWTKRLLLLRTSTDVISSKFGTTKDTLRFHLDLSNSFWSHSTECQEFFQLSGLSTTCNHQFMFKLMKQQRRGYRRHFFSATVVKNWELFTQGCSKF